MLKFTRTSVDPVPKENLCIFLKQDLCYSLQALTKFWLNMFRRRAVSIFASCTALHGSKCRPEDRLF